MSYENFKTSGFVSNDEFKSDELSTPYGLLRAKRDDDGKYVGQCARLVLDKLQFSELNSVEIL